MLDDSRSTFNVTRHKRTVSNMIDTGSVGVAGLQMRVTNTFLRISIFEIVVDRGGISKTLEKYTMPMTTKVTLWKKN